MHVATVDRLSLNRPDLFRFEAYVAGRWVGGELRIDVANPATGELLGSVPDLGADAAEQAVTAAQEALPAWRALSAKERSAALSEWHRLIVENAEDLARIMTAEQGKPLAESRGEIAYAAGFVEWYAEEAKRAYGSVIPGNLANRRILVTEAPVGVVGAITPWNFPAAMITRKAGPALAAGCTMVVKPSELTPFSALALAVLAEEAGIPPGVLSIVTGAAAPIGDVLTLDPRVRKFTFTGSTAVGKLLAAKCAGTVKRVSLELGGNAPFIVFDDADLNTAVRGVMASKFRNAGQTCVCANRIYVQTGIHDAFAAELARAAAALKVGDGLAPGSEQGPLINAQAVTKVSEHIADALGRGARVLTGGAPTGVATFFEPTVLIDVPLTARMCREETFGPVAGLIRFETETEVIASANDTPAGLAAYIYSRDLDRTWRVSEGLEYGMVGVNTGIISTEVAPFGGVKESGLGREGSALGLREYLEPKTITIEVSPEAAVPVVTA